MGIVQRLSCFLLLTMLVGCGGGGSLDGSDSSSTNGDTTDSSSNGDDSVVTITADDISLYANTQQISSDGSQEVTLTAIAKNSGNNLLEGITVQFASDSGQLQIVNAVTGSDGKATATLTTENAPENRLISISAISSNITDSITVQVIGTTVSFTGSASLALSDPTPYIINVLNSNGTGIANVNVALTLTNAATNGGNVANITIPDSVTTDSNGQVTVNITGTSGGTNSIVANALGASSTHAVAVQADSFLFTSFNNTSSTVNPSLGTVIPDVLLSNQVEVTLSWLREGQPVTDGTQVDFSSTRGILAASSAGTVDGKVTARVTSNNSGKALLTFSGTDNDNGEVIELNNQLEFEFVAETANAVVAQVFPQSIGPNGQTSTISVVVRDINGNLVKNKMIDFTLTDTNGGTIYPANAITDSSGSASTVYTSNAVSAQDDVSIIATVREDTSIFDTVTLTVADSGLFISLGTGNSLIEKDNNSYTKQYTVFVTDVDSNPIKNQALTVSAVPQSYYKGAWYQIYNADGDFETWAALGATGAESRFKCVNEDLNTNGTLDAGEDTNDNGMLTPGNVVAAEGQITTDDDGQATIDIDYAQSFARWIDIRLVVSGQVGGTESSAQAIFTLPVLASDVSAENVTPPRAGIGRNGPFGLLGDCSTSD